MNISKSKVMVVSREGGHKANIKVEVEKMKQVECYRYLGTDIHESGRMEEEIAHKVREGEKVGGALRAVWRGKNMSVKAMRGMYEAIVVPTVTYGSEAWVMNKRERSRVEAVEMKCLRAICGVTKFDRVRNDWIQEGTGVKMKLGERIEQANLRWYGHVRRMDEGRHPRRMEESEVPGKRTKEGQGKGGWTGLMKL